MDPNIMFQQTSISSFENSAYVQTDKIEMNTSLHV